MWKKKCLLFTAMLTGALSMILMVADHNRSLAGTSNYGTDLGNFWNNEAYWVQDTTEKIGVGLGSNGLLFPNFLQVGNEYLAFYYNNTTEGFDYTDGHGINMAKSLDGVNFTDYGEVVAPEPADRYTAFPGTWYENGTIYMVYEHNLYGVGFSIALATSTDGGHTFTKQGDILSANSSYWYESGGIGTPNLYKEGDTWYLYYHGFDGGQVHINVATGTDLHALIRSTNNPVIASSMAKSAIDSGTVGKRGIVYDDGYYYMGYEVSSAPVLDNGYLSYAHANWSTTLGRSSDLIHWEKYAQSNVIPWRTPAWGNDGTDIVMIGGTPYLYVRDYNDAGRVWAKRYRLANDTAGGGYDASYEAESADHDTGHAIPDGRRVVPGTDAAGYMLIGPSMANSPGGENLAIFKTSIANNTLNNDPVLRIEVYDSTTNAILMGREVSRQSFKQANHDEFFILPYQSIPGHTLQLRAYWYGNAELSMDKAMVKYNDPHAHRYPVADGDVQLITTFEAEGAYAHDTGSLAEAGTAWSADSVNDSPGYLLYGQQATAIPATGESGHIASFKMKIDDVHLNDAKIADLEVYDQATHTLLAKRPIYRKEFAVAGAYQDFYVTFPASGVAQKLDFKVYWDKEATLTVDHIKIYGVPGEATDNAVSTMDFNSLVDGLVGWMPTINYGNTAIWKNEAGELSGNTPSAEQSFIMAGSVTNWLDYSLEAKVKIVSSPGIGGLVFRAADNRNFYLLQIRSNGISHTLELYKCQGGSYTSLATADPSIAVGTWHQYRIEAVGSTIKVYQDDVLQMAVADLSFINGMIGANVTSYSHVHFDDFVVKQVNIAPQAVVTASSQFDGSYAPRNVVDSTGSEWASQGELEPWIRLDWANPKRINKIVLQDRANLIDHIHGGTLIFSDGSTIAVTAIPNDGSPLEINFADKTATWVKFEASGGTGYNNGLAAFQVYRDIGPREFEAEGAAYASYHQTGSDPFGDSWSASVGTDVPNRFMLYGPYVADLLAGKHNAMFRIMTDSAGLAAAICKIDIRDNTTGDILGQELIVGTDFTTNYVYQDFSLPFVQNEGHQIEFRVYWYGNGWTRVDKVIVM